MGKSAPFAALLFILVAFVSASSNGDVATSSSPPSALAPNSAPPEPITGPAAVSAPGKESIAKDPFVLFEPGPPGTKTWSYSDLSPAEKAYVDKNADTTGWDQVHNTYASAIRERAIQAAGDAAAHQLGVVDPLGMTGVVP